MMAASKAVTTAVSASATSELRFRRLPFAASSTLPSSPCCPLLSADRGDRLSYRGGVRFTISKRDEGSVLQPVNTRMFSWSPPRVLSGEAEGSPSVDDMVLDEESLRRDLDKAIEEEDYARAAELRDQLRYLYEDNKTAVLSANDRFYHSFRNGDLSAMHAIWFKGEHVYVIHPGAGRISGYDLVMQSWEVVCNAEYEFPLHIDLKNVEVHVRGDIGYVTCMEFFKAKGSSWGKQLATNVYEKINGQWDIYKDGAGKDYSDPALDASDHQPVAS